LLVVGLGGGAGRYFLALHVVVNGVCRAGAIEAVIAGATNDLTVLLTDSSQCWTGID
jgi:hypothetical protein